MSENGATGRASSVASTSRSVVASVQSSTRPASSVARLESASGRRSSVGATDKSQAVSNGASDISEEDAEEEEEEPLLKYSRIGGAAAQIFEKDSASSLVVSDKFIVIGTHSGHLFILNHAGDFVKRFKPHLATIQDVDIDETSGFIATASVDGKISVLELSIPEMSVYDMRRPLRAVSLEPNFGKRNTRQFACGGMAGNLVLHEKGWLGNKETVLHSGEGPVWAVEWRGNLIAWANDEGVGIFDVSAGRRVTTIRREPNSPRADLFKCTLRWQNDRRLLIAWADTLKIVSVKERIDRSKGQLGLSGATAIVGEVKANLQLDAMISSVAPYGKDAYLLLAYVTQDTFDKEATDNYAEQKRREAQRPELRIVSIAGEELTMDELNLNGFARNLCSDYTVARSIVDNSYIILSPQDALVALRRDATDHVSWLIERGRYQEALKAVERLNKDGQAAFDVLDIGRRFLDRLVQEERFEEAAQQCAGIFGDNAKGWEDWILVCIEKGQIASILPHVPTRKPRLDHVVYEVVLAHLLRRDPENLLRTIHEWPAEIYDIEVVINAVEGALDADKPPNTLLIDCLADLYILNRSYSKALPLFLKLRRPGVLDLVRDHNLFTAVQDQALQLIEFDRDSLKGKGKDNGLPPESMRIGPALRHGAAVQLLVDNAQSIPIPRVVKQLAANRFYLYMYLDALFDADPHLVLDYSDLQVELYTEYDYAKLMDFLRASNYYDLERAYEACKERDFVPEMVFLLGRMGNNKEALSLIIQRLDDVQRAIDFAKEQNDEDLWEDLLKYSETRPRFIRGLLENVGPHIDPVKLIRRIKDGLEIPGLKAAIIKILHDYGLQLSLMGGCQEILLSDFMALHSARQAGQGNAFVGGPESLCQHCNKALFIDENSDRATTAKGVAVVFLCRHVFHAGCAFPDDELPIRPEHTTLPRDLLSDVPGSDSANRAIASRIRFAAVLRSRVSVRCPACAHVKRVT